MKTKIPILIAAGLFLATVTKAQYPGGYADSRVVIQGRVFIPGPPVISFEYNNVPREQYVEYRDRRDGEYSRYNDRRDWREIEYERYCRETWKHRMSREDFYRDRCNYRNRPYYTEHREAGCRY
jgi:hypothetical protein